METLLMVALAVGAACVIYFLERRRVAKPIHIKGEDLLQQLYQGDTPEGTAVVSELPSQPDMAKIWPEAAAELARIANAVVVIDQVKSTLLEHELAATDRSDRLEKAVQGLMEAVVGEVKEENTRLQAELRFAIQSDLKNVLNTEYGKYSPGDRRRSLHGMGATG